MPNYYGPKIATDGLQLYLDAANTKSYPGSGTVWSDLSGNSSSTSSLVNGPTYSSDDGGAIVFDGSNDYINGPSDSSLYTTNITVEAWIRVTANPSDWVRIVGTGGNTGNRTFGLWYAVDRRLLWQRYGAGDPSLYPTSPTLDLNSWNHVAATTSGNSHVLYKNGAVISVGLNANGPWAASNEKITFGFAGFHTYTTGRIASVKLYTTALSKEQILENYNANKARFGL